MAKSRLIGDYPVIGIRSTIDGRRGKIKIRESLEDQTMNMAKAAAKLIEENVFYSNGEHVKVVIADTTIGRVAEAAACADKIKKSGTDLITLASILRIPVCMHNVDESKIYRPAAWNAFGMDKEGQDYRACEAYGPMYKNIRR